MGFRDLACNVEAEASTLGLVRHEGFEQVVGDVGCGTWACVVHVEGNAIITLVLQFDNDSRRRRNGIRRLRGRGFSTRLGRLALFHGFDSIENEIQDELSQCIGITVDWRDCRRFMIDNLNAGMVTRWTDQADGACDDRWEGDCLVDGGFCSANCEEAMEVGLHQMKLAEGDVEGLAIVAIGTLALMQLDGHAAAGGGIAKLVCDARAQLTERTELFVAADLAFILAELFGHLVEGDGEVANFVVAAGDCDGLEIAAGDGCRTLA